MRRAVLAILVLMLLPLVALLMPPETAQAKTYTEEDVQRLREMLGLDRPILIQYVTWIWDLLRGDLGDSFITRQPLFDEIKRQFPVSLQLSLLSFAAVLIFSIPMGMLAAVKQDGWLDYVMRGMSIVFLAMPTFFVGLLIAIICTKHSTGNRLMTFGKIQARPFSISSSPRLPLAPVAAGF